MKMQLGGVYWLYGLSGAGKSTLALEAAKHFRAKGLTVLILDGDQLRSGLSSDLDYSVLSRTENVRRAAELAKLLYGQGCMIFVTLMTPKIAMRVLAKSIVGSAMRLVYIQCDYNTCALRDTKGLYRKAEEKSILNLPGKDMDFEESENESMVINTLDFGLNESKEKLINYIENLESEGAQQWENYLNDTYQKNHHNEN